MTVQNGFRRRVGMIAGGLCGLAVAAVASACTTPVYRYAMYNWATSPYVVLCFHQGQPSEEATKFNEAVMELYRGEPPANVVVEPVDLSKEDPWAGYPQPVKAVYEAHPDEAKPGHIVLSPWLAEVYAGQLDEGELKAMVESPARTKMAQLLHEGHAAVLLFVPGKDEGVNKKSR
ncbi:MAG TPA: hypothetical protein EYP56_04115, partial [Planctomycetaceae bacterium]|nr:hypothetical protein [Planctomycetaceae bacterium]